MSSPAVPDPGIEPAESFTRPNGKPYKPRSPELSAHAWENTGYPDDSAGVIIFGTLDPEKARAFALQMSAYWYSTTGVTSERPGWFRFGYVNGAQAWLDDAERGRPGVIFTACDVDQPQEVAR